MLSVTFAAPQRGGRGGGYGGGRGGGRGGGYGGGRGGGYGGGRGGGYGGGRGGGRGGGYGGGRRGRRSIEIESQLTDDNKFGLMLEQGKTETINNGTQTYLIVENISSEDFIPGLYQVMYPTGPIIQPNQF